MKIGGYQILDVYNYTFTVGTGVKVDGSYKLIKALRGKPINTSRIKIGSVTYDAAYLAFIPDGTSFKATFGDKTITIAADDTITFTNGIIGGGGGGGGGSTVTVTATATTGNEVGKINVDGVETTLKSGNVGDTVEVTQVQGSGAKIATITVNGSDTDIYAPSATGQVQADWTESDSSDPSYIQNKPSLATVATSGSYSDLSNTPTIPAAQVQSDWTESDSSDPSYIKNKPSLATVATSGSYSDLSNTPTIPAAQVQADWTESDSSDPSFIQNKPTIPAGIPAGGSAGQVLTKDSGTDYDVSWTTQSGGGTDILNYPVYLEIPSTTNLPNTGGTSNNYSSMSLTALSSFGTFLSGNPDNGTYVFNGVIFGLSGYYLTGMVTSIIVETVSNQKRYNVKLQGTGYHSGNEKTYSIVVYGYATYDSTTHRLTFDVASTGGAILIACLG